MPDKKLTDSEIIKALECCCNAQCSKCKYYGTGNANCVKTNMIDSLDLINRLQALDKKNENIIRLADKTIATQNAEIERLNKLALERHLRIHKLNGEIEELRKIRYLKTKAEAYKEFAELFARDIEERLSDGIKERNPDLYVIHIILNERLKELVGDINAS